MGAGNALLAYARWGHLPHRPVRLLVFMALVSLDKERPPRCFAGRGLLAERGLGMDPQSDAGRQAVKQTVRDLSAAGALWVIEPPSPRRAACYGLNLTLDGGSSATPVEGETGAIQLPQLGSFSYPTGVAELPDGGHSLTPRGVRGGRGLGEEANSTQVSTSPAAEAEYASARMILSSLPDLGASLLAGQPDGMPLRDRVIAAAAARPGTTR